jgi:hypothetical protein
MDWKKIIEAIPEIKPIRRDKSVRLPTCPNEQINLSLELRKQNLNVQEELRKTSKPFNWSNSEN